MDDLFVALDAGGTLQKMTTELPVAADVLYVVEEKEARPFLLFVV